jgi:uncharacterized protein (DUF1778 family)
MEEEKENEKHSKDEDLSGHKNTTWPVRCSQAQKELLQSLAYASGQNVADFLVTAAKQASPQTKAETALEKDLVEVDGLIERLTRVMKAKVMVAHEVQKQAEESTKELEAHRAQIETELQEKRNAVESELLGMRQALEDDFHKKEHEWEKALEDVNQAWEKKWLAVKEIQERLESELQQKNQEAQVREKQYADSVRLHESIEQRSFDLKAQNDEIKKKLVELEKYKEATEQSLPFFEKQVAELKYQAEIQKVRHEEELKHLEKEYELKCKLIEHEIDKKLRNELKNN